MLLNKKKGKQIFAMSMSLLLATVGVGSLNTTYARDSEEASPESKTYYYKGKEEVYTVPYSGIYQIEAQGAKGGGPRGGNGGITRGNLYLEAGDKLYINVGGNGSTSTATVYNGGGKNTFDSQTNIAGSGGGATSISYNSGKLTKSGYDKNSLIMIAGGGGGDGTNHRISRERTARGGRYLSSINGPFSPRGGTGTYTSEEDGGGGGGGYDSGNGFNDCMGDGGSSYIASSLTNCYDLAGGADRAQASITLLNEGSKLTGTLTNQGGTSTEGLLVSYNGVLTTTDSDGNFELISSTQTEDASPVIIADSDCIGYIVDTSLVVVADDDDDDIDNDNDTEKIDTSKTEPLQSFELYSEDGELIGTYTKEVPTTEED